MGHKRPKSQSRIERDQLLQKRKKERRAAKWKRDREKWASDKEYQEHQRKRKDRLRAKGGYEANIQLGIEEKAAAKEKRSRKRGNK